VEESGGKGWKGSSGVIATTKILVWQLPERKKGRKGKRVAIKRQHSMDECGGRR